MSHPIMYLRREPAQEPDAVGRFDVVYYRQVGPNKPSTIPCGRCPWYLTTKPTRRNKYVNFNCDRYLIHWLTEEGKPE